MIRPPKQIVPMAHVADVGRSIAFYERLGLELVDRHVPEGGVEPVWAYLACGSASLMLAQASEPVGRPAVLLYAFFDDIAATHAALRGLGLPVGELTYPFYCPKGEFRLTDPDGYCLVLAHT